MVRSLLFGALLLAASPAHAALDEVLSKKAADVTVEKLDGHSLRVRTRGTVKEFAGSDGKVFGATWAGTERIDLAELLGAHFEAFKEAQRQSRLGLHQLVVATPELRGTILQNGSYAEGRFWVPARVPAGVKIDALR